MWKHSGALSLPSKQNLFLLSVTSHFPSHPLPLATTNLLFIHVDLPIPDISHKWTHSIRGLLCLDSFTQHNVSKVHPCGSLYQYFIPLYGQIILYCIVYNILPSHSSGDSCLHFLAIMNNATNVFVKVSQFLMCSQS